MYIRQLEHLFCAFSQRGETLHTFLALENASVQMHVSWHLELMISQLPERQCILSYQRSMTITFNIIIYTHIIPQDRLSIGCLAAISHPPLIGSHPHFFMLRYVTLRWFAGQNRSSCEISFLSFSECLSQGEILWYCHWHNVLRLQRGKKKKYENEIKRILSYSLSNNISLCRDVNCCVCVLTAR